MFDLTKLVEKMLIEHINSLRAMKIGDVKEYVLDNITHRIKRVDKYTWEYICPCCSGKRIAMGNVKPKSGPDTKL